MASRNSDVVIPADILLDSYWRNPVRYRLQKDIKMAGYRVPAGFISDGATVPRIAWAIFPPVGRYLTAAIIHDHALINGLGWTVANDLFDQVLRDLDIVGWRRMVLVSSARLTAAWQHFKVRIGMHGKHVV